jgi:hypothetical protein
MTAQQSLQCLRSDLIKQQYLTLYHVHTLLLLRQALRQAFSGELPLLQGVS